MTRQPDTPPASQGAASARLAAVALAYRAGSNAPQVTAKGRGAVAEQIIRRAREAGIYVHQSRDLVGLLMQVDLDQHIPPQLYVAVAELLAWLYRLERATASGASIAAALGSAPAKQSPTGVPAAGH
jgi:flagellar biosynthesis protein